MKIEFLPIQDIKPYGNNPRQNDGAVDAVAKSIKKFGFRQPIVVDKFRVIVAGHTRWKAAQKLGILMVPVHVADDLTPEQARAYRIADNKVAEHSFWEMEKLEAELKILDSIGQDLQELGFSENELEKILGDEYSGSKGLTDADAIPEPPAEPISKTGDLWILGNHRLLCGDCTKPEDVARVMDGQKAKLIATDPPYGVDYAATKAGMPVSGLGTVQDRFGDIANDEMKDAELQSFLESCFRVALPHLEKAAWYLWHANLTEGYFTAAAAAADVLYHRKIVWVKPGFVLTRSGMYHWKHECCFFGWRKGQQPPWYGEKNQTSVWDIGRDADHGKIHPTQKPIELFCIPMRNHTKQGEVCYEPFSGSGSQIIAAESLGRRCFAIEIEPRYIDVAVKRWEEFTGKKAVKA